MAQASGASSKRSVLDEIYNLAAQSHVRVSFDQPEYTADAVATGTLRVLEAAGITTNAGKQTRITRLGSSEDVAPPAPPRNENHSVLPPQPLRRKQSRRPLVCG